MSSDAGRQLQDELHARVVMPLAGLLGVDIEAILRLRVQERAEALVSQLQDEGEAKSVAVDLMKAIWQDQDPHPEWWGTPLGCLCASVLATTATEAITHSVAAAILNVPRGSIGTMVHRGVLERHPRGGVSRASVLERVASKRGARFKGAG